MSARGWTGELRAGCASSRGQNGEQAVSPSGSTSLGFRRSSAKCLSCNGLSLVSISPWSQRRAQSLHSATKTTLATAARLRAGSRAGGYSGPTSQFEYIRLGEMKLHGGNGELEGRDGGDATEAPLIGFRGRNAGPVV